VTATTGRADGLGVRPGDAVQEIGWDSDCDEDLRAAVSAACGSELIDEDSHEVVNVVLLWFRTWCCCGSARTTATWPTP